MLQHHWRRREPKKNKTNKHKRHKVSSNSALAHEEVLSGQLPESALEPQATENQETRFTMSFFISKLKLWLGLGLQSHTKFQSHFKFFSIFKAASTTVDKKVPTAMAYMEMHSTKMDSTTIASEKSSKPRSGKGGVRVQFKNNQIKLQSIKKKRTRMQRNTVQNLKN